MKLIVAHLPNDAFESVRTGLLDLGVLRMTISQVHSSVHSQRGRCALAERICRPTFDRS